MYWGVYSSGSNHINRMYSFIDNKVVMCSYPPGELLGKASTLFRLSRPRSTDRVESGGRVWHR
ncbi:hypothetical protein F9C07_10628 [Aspergillus flavus]|uniref:Uncharacterized protein n=1 Tax=Aspergillus flavus (strain ATCC 200026 / FGSC A1120 / IAM 13836 / NRRL 3357 / JCM 12722 / SRRC 167) TaxID=332952 RepID=A0A7U2MVA0_ASPFN|nr:hypothetical protein F9C07_10628 [Aspergillus flavus]